MAAKKHTPNHAHVRKHQMQRKRRRPSLRQGASRRHPVARGKVARSKALDGERMQDALEDHIRGLNQAMSAVIVSVAALRRQNCDIDEDIARVLERSAADRLDIEIEKLQVFVGKEVESEQA